MRATLACAVLLGVTFAGCLVSSTPGSEQNDSTEAPVCASGATVNGIDVSYYQGKIDWTKAKGAGIDFAFARVSDGTGFVDPQFAANWANMKAAGVVRGAYQFFRPETDPVAQANLLVAQINAAGGLEAGDLAPVIDVEVTDSVATSTIVSRVSTWLQTVQAATGLVPTIYTSPGFWSTLGSPKGFGKYALWVANWGVSCPSVPTSSWSTWRFWQNADTGTVPGVGSAPDLDKFNGSLADLIAFAGGQGGAGDGGTSDCTVNGVAGTCIDTSACSAMPGHVSTPGHCPGAANIECCTPSGSSSSSSTSSTSTSSTSSSSSSSTSSTSSSSSTSSTSSSTSSSSGAPPPACSVAGVAGTCIATSTCSAETGYTSTPGYCAGPANIECCTPPPKCTVAGVAGICIQTSLCATLPGHKSTPGYCPGPATEECCTP